MPVFHFNVRDGHQLFRDEAGVQLADAVAARDWAMHLARNAIADKIESGEIVGGQVFEICDEHGTVVTTVPFRDALLLG